MHEDIQLVPACDGYQPFRLVSCGVSRCDKSYHIVRHKAAFGVFEFVIKGTGTVHTADGVIHPCEGDIYFLHQGDDHNYYADESDPWTKIWFNLSGELVRSIVSEYGLRDKHIVHGLDLRGMFEEMLNLSREDIPAQEIHNRAASLFLEIVCKIADRLREEKSTALPDAVAIKDYILRNAERNIRAEELEELVSLSKSQVTRIFKKEYGVTPYEYLLSVKTENAKWMLMNTQLKVQEIATRLGFSDAHYFSNFFKLKTGVSPQRFREEA